MSDKDKPEGAPFMCPECESWLLRHIATNAEPTFRHAMHCPHNRVIVDFVSLDRELAHFNLLWPVSAEKAEQMIRNAGAVPQAMRDNTH